MPKQSHLINETIMYSVNKETGDIVTHHLPWSRTSPQLEIYLERGLTFERPRVTDTIERPLISRQDARGVEIMSPVALKEKPTPADRMAKARAAKKAKAKARVV